MSRFRKKPVTIDAVRACEALHCASRNWSGLPGWLVAAYDRGGVVFARDHVSLPTPEGTMRAERDDWIICGVRGEVYPCKPDIFAATYERVVEANDPDSEALRRRPDQEPR